MTDERKQAMDELIALGADEYDVPYTPRQVAWMQDIEWHRAAGRSVMANANLGMWMSAALSDPAVCDHMKADIREWFSAGEPVSILGQALGNMTTNALALAQTILDGATDTTPPEWIAMASEIVRRARG